MTIPEKNISSLPADLFAGVSSDVVVVDTGDSYPRQRDGRIDGIEDGMTESRWVEQKLGQGGVKAFNNIYAEHLLKLGKPAGAAGRIALPVAGDNGAAKAVVLRLVDELGFDGVDAGGLDQSWRQQPGTPVYTKDFDAAGVKRALAEARPDRTPDWRATGRQLRKAGLRRASRRHRRPRRGRNQGVVGLSVSRAAATGFLPMNIARTRFSPCIRLESSTPIR